MNSATTPMTSHNAEGCHDQSMLIDADQQVNTKTDTWRMKYRFHFEEYTTQLNTFRVYGARFPTEIYTRGCHWIPRMLA
jgi:hypothetical protein